MAITHELSSNSEDLSSVPLTSAQESLRKLHGTPEEFSNNVYSMCPFDISRTEAAYAVEKYKSDWIEAGKYR